MEKKAQAAVWNLRSLSDRVVETVVAQSTNKNFRRAPALLVIAARVPSKRVIRAYCKNIIGRSPRRKLIKITSLL
jgi:hypothetical protein